MISYDFPPAGGRMEQRGQPFRRDQVWRRGVRAAQGPSPHPRTDSAGSPRTSGAAAGGLAARADVNVVQVKYE